MDIVQDGVQLQCLCNYNHIRGGESDTFEFAAISSDLHRGDIISQTHFLHMKPTHSSVPGVKGYPHRTTRNELSIQATELPQLLSRCLNALPDKVKNEETMIRNRPMHLLIERRPAEILRLRSEILKFLRLYLSEEGFVDVQTPILADAAGGAIARPFHTSATEFSDRKLALRIAPELWLKRLIIGGFERIYEIGPSFRNEGSDAIFS